MKKLNEITTEEELRELVDDIFGEGKECEKSLFMACSLFLLSYCPRTEHNYSHVVELALAADVPEGQRHPRSDLDKMMEQVMSIDPLSKAQTYHKAFQAYSHQTQGQAIGKLVYTFALEYNNDVSRRLRILNPADDNSEDETLQQSAKQVKLQDWINNPEQQAQTKRINDNFFF